MNSYTREFAMWCINKHHKTNHMYGDDVQYGFHLRKVAKAAEKFKYFMPRFEPTEYCPFPESLHIILCACYGHDLIEDVRATYNNVLDALKKYTGMSHSEALYAAEIIYACTDYTRGKTRLERVPDYIYKEILETPGALFVKLCDKIANVEHGIYMSSSMVDKYRSELPHFLEMVKNDTTYALYKPLFDHYENLLKY